VEKNSDGWMTVKQFLKGHNSTCCTALIFFFLILDLNKTNRYT
jgi:hypothetical protein